jgi:hypothetical protein
MGVERRAQSACDSETHEASCGARSAARVRGKASWRRAPRRAAPSQRLPKQFAPSFHAEGRSSTCGTCFANAVASYFGATPSQNARSTASSRRILASVDAFCSDVQRSRESGGTRLWPKCNTRLLALQDEAEGEPENGPNTPRPAMGNPRNVPDPIQPGTAWPSRSRRPEAVQRVHWWLVSTHAPYACSFPRNKKPSPSNWLGLWNIARVRTTAAFAL